jgi:HSP20 family molecular chaperone IbpA
MNQVTTTSQNNGIAHGSTYQRRSVAPPVDVFENADELLLVADVPGVAAGSLDVRVENDMLTLEARREVPKDEPPALAREYEEVDFATRVRIPAGIDTANISAEAKNGTVLVRLPKAAAAKARKIVVRPK